MEEEDEEEEEEEEEAEWLREGGDIPRSEALEEGGREALKEAPELVQSEAEAGGGGGGGHSTSGGGGRRGLDARWCSTLLRDETELTWDEVGEEGCASGGWGVEEEEEGEAGSASPFSRGFAASSEALVGSGVSASSGMAEGRAASSCLAGVGFGGGGARLLPREEARDRLDVDATDVRLVTAAPGPRLVSRLLISEPAGLVWGDLCSDSWYPDESELRRDRLLPPPSRRSLSALPLVWCAGAAAAGGGAAGGGAGACLFLGRARLSEELGRERGGGGWLEVRVAEDEAGESGRGVGRPSADSSERAGLTLRSPALPDDKLLSPVEDLVFLEKSERSVRRFLSSGCEMAAMVMRSVTESGGARKSRGTTHTSCSW